MLYLHISEAFFIPASSSGPSGLSEIKSNLREKNNNLTLLDLISVHALII